MISRLVLYASALICALCASLSGSARLSVVWLACLSAVCAFIFASSGALSAAGAEMVVCGAGITAVLLILSGMPSAVCPQAEKTGRFRLFFLLLTAAGAAALLAAVPQAAAHVFALSDAGKLAGESAQFKPAEYSSWAAVACLALVSLAFFTVKTFLPENRGRRIEK